MIMVVVLRYILSSSTHMGVQEECVFNWKYPDSYKDTMPGLTLRNFLLIGDRMNPFER
jgi:hypothetical protein